MEVTRKGITLEISDVSGQKRAIVRDVDPEIPASVLVEQLIHDMREPRHDVEGRPLAYNFLRTRDGLHIRPSERIGTAAQSGDKLVLHPDVEAG
jgi:hypothetical protein